MLNFRKIKENDFMLGKQMIYNEYDFEAIKILNNFLPDKIFDSHAHLFNTDFTPALLVSAGHELNLDLEKYVEEMSTVLCRPKKLRLNIIGYPDATGKPDYHENIAKSDKFLVDQLNKDSDNVGEIIVTPTDTVDTLEKRIALHPNIKGLKCYHLFAPKSETFRCEIGEYLPECAWEVANKHKMVITLHMVKDLALADEGNRKYIIEMAKKYPDATLILAHAARSFATWTAVENVEKVAHLENVWFDFSAVCESPAMLAIIKKAGLSRCMWGSDYMVCRARGKAISLADVFYWIYQSDLDNFSSKTSLKSWLIATENLMATRQACILADLKEKDIEDLFYNNAARLFERNNY